MAKICLISQDPTHASATNVETALENKGHTVVSIDDSDVATHDFFPSPPYDLICITRPPAGSTFVTQMRSLLNDDRFPMIAPMIFGGANPASTGQTGFATNMRFCGTLSVADGAPLNADETEIIVSHPVTAGFTLARQTVKTAKDYQGAVDTGQSYIGTALSEGDPDETYTAGKTDGLAIEKWDLDMDGTPIAARVVVFGWLYNGFAAATSDGETLLDQAVDWVTTASADILRPSFITSGAQVFSPTLVEGGTIAPAFLASSAAVFSPALTSSISARLVINGREVPIITPVYTRYPKTGGILSTDNGNIRRSQPSPNVYRRIWPVRTDLLGISEGTALLNDLLGVDPVEVAGVDIEATVEAWGRSVLVDYGPTSDYMTLEFDLLERTPKG